MTTDLDIHRSAAALIKRYGEDAPIQAAMRADELLDEGNLDRQATEAFLAEARAKAIRDRHAQDNPVG